MSRDMHRQEASRMFGVPYDKVTDEQREAAKVKNHAAMYGVAMPPNPDPNVNRLYLDLRTKLMAKNDKFAYHRHLERVARADIDYVRHKDVHYDASWKRHDGQGAFFTIVRPWDRFYSIAKKNGYDIFTVIGQESMEGPDGSLIACVRDLRRYLLLLEAEMTERGGVFHGEDVTFTAVTGDKIEVVSAGIPCTGREDVILESVDDGTFRMVTEKAREGDTVVSHVSEGKFEIVNSGLNVCQCEHPMIRCDHRGCHCTYCGLPERHEPLVGTVEALVDRPGTPEDGGQHASTWPWVLDRRAVQSMEAVDGSAVSDVWSSGGVLEPRISTEMHSELARRYPMVAALYTPVYKSHVILDDAAMVPSYWDEPSPPALTVPEAYWLDIRKCPPQERDRYRVLPVEQNLKESEALMEYIELYSWIKDRYVLRRRAWREME